MKVSECTGEWITIFIHLVHRIVFADGDKGASGANLKIMTVILAQQVVHGHRKEDGPCIVDLETTYSNPSANPVLAVGEPGVEIERGRSEEHTSELQSLMRISYAVFCLKKKNKRIIHK